jgi:hypothetical protein
MLATRLKMLKEDFFPIITKKLTDAINIADGAFLQKM